jgi:hypothetical protein
MGEITLDGGSIEMDTDATGAAMNALEVAGSDLQRVLSPQLRHIKALERQLGQGPLGRPFAESYNAEVVPLEQNTDVLAGIPERAAASGRSIVATYERVEAEITAALQV